MAQFKLRIVANHGSFQRLISRLERLKRTLNQTASESLAEAANAKLAPTIRGWIRKSPIKELSIPDHIYLRKLHNSVKSRIKNPVTVEFGYLGIDYSADFEIGTRPHDAGEGTILNWWLAKHTRRAIATWNKNKKRNIQRQRLPTSSLDMQQIKSEAFLIHRHIKRQGTMKHNFLVTALSQNSGAMVAELRAKMEAKLARLMRI